MIKLLSLFLLCVFAQVASAQTSPSNMPETMPYGKVDKADLEMTACDFEKDANAEILFDKGTVYFDQQYNLIYERHKRIKIFNDNGKDEGSIQIEYLGGSRTEYISNIQAQTINISSGAIQIEKVDKKLIYTKPVNKYVQLVSFAFPNVKPGSVLEYKYTITVVFPYIFLFPDWYFQSNLPTRYSEFNTTIPTEFYYKNLVMVHQPYVKNTNETRSMANIPSINDEPYMTCRKDNEQRIISQLLSVHLPGYFPAGFSENWQKVGEDEVKYEDFGEQFHRKLTGEEDIINKAKSLSSDDAKIAFIFNAVKDQMKWDESYERFTEDGTVEAWKKKTGNSTEINLILCHLLKKTGLNALPMLTSTRSHGKVNPAYPSNYQFNTTVAYIPVDSANFYVLDATDKFNSYREIPENLLNNFGLYIDKENKKYELLFIQKTTPVREVSLINAEISTDGKMTGTTQTSSFSYNRLSSVKKYKKDGEEKYVKQLTYGDNNLKITSLKFENMDVDTLPLIQTFNFNQDLTGSDENYIYFKPNYFAAEYVSSFLSEKRFTDINFGYVSNSTFIGNFKIPTGYKVDGTPKNISMTMPDNSISFRRIVGEQNGSLIIRYSLFIKKSLYFKENYPEFHEFFKKLNEMLNDQVVLKKS